MTLSAAEQYFLELTNRARLDPLAEAARQGIDLNTGLAPGTISTAPRQVLAPNMALADAAAVHSQYLLEVDRLSHTGADGSSPGDRMADAGYEFRGSSGWAENIALLFGTAAINLESAVLRHHNSLYGSPGHRTNTFSTTMSEAGIGQVAGIYTQNGTDYQSSVLTLKLAYSNAQTFVTGVAYDDRDGDGFYSVGEGIAGVAIRVGSTTAITMAAGGYAVQADRRADVAVAITHDATGESTLTMDLSAGNGKLDIVQTDDGLWSLGLSASATLQGGIAHATLLGASDLTLAGSAADNRLSGNGGDNEIFGGDGNDTLLGGDGDDTLHGGAGDDLLIGGTGTNELHDGAGSDTMIGGPGASLFVMAADGSVDTITGFIATTDRIDMRAWSDSAATPVVQSTSFGMTITVGNEVLHVHSSTGLAIDPSTLPANALILPSLPPLAVQPHQILTGTSGNDTLIGGAGNDSLDGGDGNDRLDGGPGDDTMAGGLGNDRYVVDSAGDVITGEVGYSLGGGIDTVEAWVSYRIPANIEILRLQGTADIDGTGNAGPGAMVGNVGNNRLDGGGGNDRITAKAGNDTLIGGLGADTLAGNEGNDVFLFTSTNESRPGQANRDFIKDFTRGEDRIDLSAIDANSLTAADDAFTFIGNRAFSGTPGELRYFTWGNTSVNIVEADTNGDRVADMQIFINQTNWMTGSDFVL